ncbi:MAG: hypothetical protein AAGM38_09185 [Pseudomonadota bacterium]
MSSSQNSSPTRRPHRRRNRLALASSLVAALTLAAPPAQADEEEPRSQPLDRFLEQEFSNEAREALQDLFAAVGPLVQRFADMMEDVPRYEAPEILPNGDIIIRRKRDEPFDPNADPDQDTET